MAEKKLSSHFSLYTLVQFVNCASIIFHGVSTSSTAPQDGVYFWIGNGSSQSFSVVHSGPQARTWAVATPWPVRTVYS